MIEDYEWHAIIASLLVLLSIIGISACCCRVTKKERSLYAKLAAARTDLPDTLTQEERILYIEKEFRSRMLNRSHAVTYVNTGYAYR